MQLKALISPYLGRITANCRLIAAFSLSTVEATGKKMKGVGYGTISIIIDFDCSAEFQSEAEKVLAATIQAGK